MNAFEKEIWDAHSQSENYHFVKHSILKVRETMLKAHPELSKLSTSKQYVIFSTISSIAMNTAAHHVSRLRFSSTDESEFSLSIMRGFEQPKSILFDSYSLINA